MSSFKENVEALKWMKEHCALHLTPWEEDFIDNVLDKVEHGDIFSFSPKQQEVIDTMWKKYVDT